MDFEAYLSKTVAQLQIAGLYRQLSAPKRFSFASNHYLGRRFGAGASRLMRAQSNAQTEILENKLAGWKNTEAALVFPTGYMANLGAISAVMGKGDLIILDKLCHASLIDGAFLSKADIRVFKHNDVSDLEDILQTVRGKYAKILVVVESVYSMDGDVSPLKALYALTREHKVWLMVDEAHAIGVFGEKGNGLVAELNLENMEIVTGTLSKAIGGLGGYVAGSRALKEFLINKARAFIYTTALPGDVVKENLKCVQRLSNHLKRKLWQNINYFYAQALLKGVKLQEPQSAIIPILLGSESAAVAASQSLEAQGLLVPAVRYPTVAKGKARLRITITADHTKKDLDKLIVALKDCV